MKKLCLYNLEQAGLILLIPTGIQLFNWTSGSSGETREAEGCFVPLSNDPLPDASREEFLDAQLGEICRGQDSVSPALASQMDSVLQQLSSSDYVQVDRQRLTESAPGWVYVVAEGQGEFSQLQGFDGEINAVLTWPNQWN